MARPCFSNVFQYAYGKHCFQCQCSLQDGNYGYPIRQGILRKIRACERLQKFFEHKQASTPLIFASNLSKGQTLRALSNWLGPFDTPCYVNQVRKKSPRGDKHVSKLQRPWSTETPNLNSIRIALYILKYWKTNLQSHPRLDKQRQQDPAMQWDINSETERNWSVWTPQKAAIK